MWKEAGLDKLLFVLVQSKTIAIDNLSQIDSGHSGPYC